MRSCLLLFIAFLAAFSKVSTEELHERVILKDELQERLQLVAKIEKLEFWKVLTAIQQERLRQAVILNTKPPRLWTRLSSYNKIVKPENAMFLWRLTHFDPYLRNFFMSQLPAVLHEDDVHNASAQPWWKDLTSDEQKEVSTLILTEKKVPQGWDSWKKAINDEKFGEWIKNRKSKILSESFQVM